MIQEGKRVVITGMGPVTPNGIGNEEFWDNISHGKSFFDTIPWAEERGYGPVKQNKIRNFDFESYFADGRYNRKTVRQTFNDDKVIQFGVLATKLALEDSGLEYDRERNNIGNIMGNANASIESNEETTKSIIQMILGKVFENFDGLSSRAAKEELKEYERLIAPEHLEEFIDLLHSKCGPIYKWTPPSVMNNPSYSIPAKISLMFGFHGPSYPVNTACSASLDAIGLAYRGVKSGLVDIMVAGGSEAPLTIQAVSAFDKVGVITKTKPKPFCLDRDGFVMAEGAGAVILEELGHARRRGARIYAEIKGFGQSVDGTGHVCAINPEGIYLEEAITHSIAESGVERTKIDYVNLHGTATKTCDVVETKVLKKVFGGHAYRLNTSSTKSMTGHAISSTGAMEVILTVKAMEKGIIPPTINLDNPDPECDLDYTPKPVERPIDNSLVISMGFGGFNTALVMSKYTS